jgi:hypothetical protein
MVGGDVPRRTVVVRFEVCAFVELWTSESKSEKSVPNVRVDVVVPFTINVSPLVQSYP